MKVRPETRELLEAAEHPENRWKLESAVRRFRTAIGEPSTTDEDCSGEHEFGSYVGLSQFWKPVRRCSRCWYSEEIPLTEFPPEEAARMTARISASEKQWLDRQRLKLVLLLRSRFDPVAGKILDRMS